MRKKELLELGNKQKKQIEDQKKQIEDQKKQIETQFKAAENAMDVFKILAEGGEIVVYIYPDKEPSYYVRSKDCKISGFEICSKKIFMGIYARGLLVVSAEHVHEEFSTQRYILRTPKEK